MSLHNVNFHLLVTAVRFLIRIGGVMISVLTSRAVGRGLEPRSG
jgi:hypothetical protein